MFAVTIQELGNLSSLRFQNVPFKKELLPDSVLIRHTSFGLGFDDISIAKNIYPASYLDQLQKNGGIIGLEATGIVEDVGENVTSFQKGDRVVYCIGSIGAFCEMRQIDQSFLRKIPDSLKNEVVVSSFRKLLYVHMLIYRVFTLRQNWTIMIYNVTNPTELMLAKAAKDVGLSVIGTVKNDEDAEKAKTIGKCDLVINSNTENIVQSVSDFTKESGVNAIFDSIGSGMEDLSIRCLRHFGLYIVYNEQAGFTQISGKRMMEKSLIASFPVLEHYKMNVIEYKEGSEFAFSALSNKTITSKFFIAPIEDAPKIMRHFEKELNKNIVFTLKK